MENKKKKDTIKSMILGSIIGILLGSIGLVSYAMYSYNNMGMNNKLIVGDIYMKYKEGSTNINISGMTPTNTLPNDYFEFEITGKNTTTNKDIWYDINIKWGDNEIGKTRIRDEFLRFTLKEKIDNGEWTIPIDAKKYSDFENGLRMWVNKIEKDQTTDTTRTYRLYVWIDSSVVIGNVNQDYTINEWNNLFASVKVDVTGDFTEKEPYHEPGTATFDTGSIVNSKLNLISPSEVNRVEAFNRVYDAPDISAFTNDNILSSPSSEEKIYSWCDNTYIENGDASCYWYTNANIVYLNQDSSYMFNNFWCLSYLDGFENVNTSNVKNMSYMFANNQILDFTDYEFLTNWNVSNVTNMSHMFDAYLYFDFSKISNWDVSNVTDMSYMFRYAFNMDSKNQSKYNNASYLNNWNVSNVTNFNNMFALWEFNNDSPNDFTYPSFTNRPGTWNNDIVTLDGRQFYAGTYVPNN